MHNELECGYSSVVERQLPKLNVVGSSPIIRFFLYSYILNVKRHDNRRLPNGKDGHEQNCRNFRGIGGTVTQGNGSRVRFDLNEISFNIHSPHPQKELKRYQVKAI